MTSTWMSPPASPVARLLRPVTPAPVLPAARPAFRPVGRAWTTTRSVLAESRPVVQVVVALRLVCATDVIVQPSLQRATMLLGWLALSIAVYVHNGLTDVDADRSNGSTRPIAAGRLGVTTARSWCVGLVVAGLTAVSAAGPTVTLAACAYLALGWAYSAGPCLKNYRHGSTAAIGGGAALTYAAGLVVAHEADWRELALVLLLSTWVGIGSMSKDFSDVVGDAVAGRRTAPVLWGTGRAASVLAVQTVATSLAVTLLAIALHSVAAAAPGVLLVLGSTVLTVTARRFASATRRAERRAPYRVFMATQYLADLALLAVLAR